ncbi:hypothetical protein ACP3V3_02990 [Vibrio sp. PNB22_3_1]
MDINHVVENAITWLNQRSAVEFLLVVATSILLGLLAITIVHPFALTHLVNRFPIIGRIDRKSKNFNVTGRFFQSEDELLGIYKLRYKGTLGDATFFHECQQYLQLAGEHGRTPTPKWKMATLFTGNLLLTLLFTPQLMPYVSSNMSTEAQLISYSVLTLTMSLIFLSISFNAGKEQYRNEIINRLIHHWTIDESAEREALVITTGLGVGSIESPSDLHRSSYQQTLNRLKISTLDTSQKFKVGAILSTTMLVATMIVVHLDSADPKSAEWCDLSQVYWSIGEATIETGNQEMGPLIKQCIKNSSDAWLSGVALFGFLLLQLLSYKAGKEHGFLSVFGAKAYHYTKHYKSLSDFINKHRARREQVIQAANSDLQKLHRKMDRNTPKNSLPDEQLHAFNTKHTRNFQLYLVQSPHDLLEHPDFIELMLQLSQKEIETIERWLMAKYKLLYDHSSEEDAFARIMVYRDDIQDLAVQLSKDR